MYFFRTFYQKNAQIMNVKNPDLMIWLEEGILWIDFPYLDSWEKKLQIRYRIQKSRFGFFPKKHNILFPRTGRTDLVWPAARLSVGNSQMVVNSQTDLNQGELLASIVNEW